MTNFKSALLVSLLFSSSSVLAEQPSSSLPTVKLSHGVVQGTTCSGTGGVKRFRGIPYAQSAAGSNRFLPPKPYNGTLGDDSKPFDATQLAAPCIQYDAEFGVSSPNASENW